MVSPSNIRQDMSGGQRRLPWCIEASEFSGLNFKYNVYLWWQHFHSYSKTCTKTHADLLGQPAVFCFFFLNRWPCTCPIYSLWSRTTNSQVMCHSVHRGSSVYVRGLFDFHILYRTKKKNKVPTSLTYTDAAATSCSGTNKPHELKRANVAQSGGEMSPTGSHGNWSATIRLDG